MLLMPNKSNYHDVYICTSICYLYAYTYVLILYTVEPHLSDPKGPDNCQISETARYVNHNILNTLKTFLIQCASTRLQVSLELLHPSGGRVLLLYPLG